MSFSSLRFSRWLLWVCLGALVVIALSLFWPESPEESPFLKKSKMIMGTEVEISVIPADEQAIEDAFAVIGKIEALMSTYKDDSEVSILNRQGEKEVSPETLEVIKEALKFSQITGGAFDITVEPLINLWKKAAEDEIIPTMQDINEVLPLVNYRNIIVEGNLIRFAKEGMQIDLGGVAKGYAVDKAIEVLKKRGIRRALVNAGGDLYALGEGPKKGEWLIGVQHPEEEDQVYAQIMVKDKAVTTSGSYRRYSIIQGERFSHIINPETGWTVQDVPISVTIVAADTTTADALATGIFVLGPNKGMELINSLPEVEGMIISEGMEVIVSQGWAAMCTRVQTN